MRASRLAAWLLPVSARRYRSALVVGALSVGLFGFVAQWAGQAAAAGASDAGGLGSAALRTIRTMVDRGMLVRRSDPTDARRSFIALTAHSAKAMEGCLEAVLNQPGQ